MSEPTEGQQLPSILSPPLRVASILNRNRIAQIPPVMLEYTGRQSLYDPRGYFRRLLTPFRQTATLGPSPKRLTVAQTFPLTCLLSLDPILLHVAIGRNVVEGGCCRGRVKTLQLLTQLFHDHATPRNRYNCVGLRSLALP